MLISFNFHLIKKTKELSKEISMEKKQYYKNMFLIAAIWNWLVGLTCLILSLVYPESITLFGVQMPPSLSFLQILFILISIFGVGFYIVHRDINSNHGIVQMSVLEKVSFFLVFLIYFIIGHVNALVLLLVIVDLIFGILFIEFLLNVKNI